MRPEFSAAILPGRLLTFLRLFLAPSALGATTVLGFAPFQFYFIPPVTLAALLLIWLRCRTFTAAATVGFAFGAGLFLAGVSWVYVSLHFYGGMAMPVAAFFTLLFCLFQACYPALACAILQRLCASTPARLMLFFPALWTITEWMRSWIFSGFPWLSIGYSQVPSSPLAGYAPLLGVFGVSLITATIAGAGASTIDAILYRRALLGHLGIQFASQLGYCTVAIGRGQEKEALALKLGAAFYLDTDTTNAANELTKLGGASVILATAPNSKSMSELIDGLGVGGKLLVVGASADPITVTPIQLIGARRSIQGWPSGTARDSEDTLNFCALTGIRPMIETFPLEQAATAYERMLSGKARFRVVLTMGG